jgi:hypothetical protein
MTCGVQHPSTLSVFRFSLLFILFGLPTELYTDLLNLAIKHCLYFYNNDTSLTVYVFLNGAF